MAQEPHLSSAAKRQRLRDALQVQLLSQSATLDPSVHLTPGLWLSCKSTVVRSAAANMLYFSTHG